MVGTRALAFIKTKKRLVKLFLLSLFCAFFLGNTLSLSNYGAVLSILGVADSGPLAGSPQELPGLDLEPYIYTPMYQIAVNNDFERYNHTSLFDEDLRAFYSLPIADWGLVFKPNMWAFFVVPPAYAYSLLCLIAILLFFSGYGRIAQKLGLSSFTATCLVAGLFFSGFVFYWWLLFSSVLALFPWLVLLVLKERKRWHHYVLLYYGFCCWLIANFYPPLIIGLVFVAVILVITLRPNFFRSWELVGIGVIAILAVGTAVYYLWDAIGLIQGSVYPGDRRVHGGQGYSTTLWLGHFFPSLLQYNLRSLTPVAAAEQVGMSSYFFLIALFFVDYKSLVDNSTKQFKYSLIVVVAALTLIWCWMLLPLPSWIGSVFLWDYVQPRRLQVASGVLIFVLTALLIGKSYWRFTLLRIVFFSFGLLLPWYLIKFTHEAVAANDAWAYLDVVLIPVVFTCYLYARVRKSEYPVKVVLAVTVLSNVLAFVPLQPLQSARPIFDTAGGSAVEILDTIVASNPGQVLALNGFEGTILNGLGYRSVGHAFFLPMPEWYRSHFPELDKNQYNYIFNRTSSVRLFHGVEAGTGGGVGVNLPIDRYGVDFQIRTVNILQDMPDRSLVVKGLQSVSDFSVDRVVISGWGNWSGLNSEQSLSIYTQAPIESATLQYAMSRRGGRAIVSGFWLELIFSEGAGVSKENLSMCLVSSDPELGQYRIRSADDIIVCDM